jgi:hypothetical protein
MSKPMKIILTISVLVGLILLGAMLYISGRSIAGSETVNEHVERTAESLS